MADEKNITSLETRQKADAERGKSRMLSPNPMRVKFVTELLSALSERRITFATAMHLDRKKIRALAEQGYVKLKHGRYQDARRVFEILSFIDHKNYFYHLALGGAYQKLKMHLDAAFQYSECLKYDPQNTNALVNRGEIFLKHKNYRRAAEDFRAAIMIDKAGRDVFANRARSLVIAIKRSIAKAKGQKDVVLPKTPFQRKKIKPMVLAPRFGKGKSSFQKR